MIIDQNLLFTYKIGFYYQKKLGPVSVKLNHYNEETDYNDKLMLSLKWNSSVTYNIIPKKMYKYFLCKIVFFINWNHYQVATVNLFQFPDACFFCNF